MDTPHAEGDTVTNRGQRITNHRRVRVIDIHIQRLADHDRPEIKRTSHRMHRDRQPIRRTLIRPGQRHRLITQIKRGITRPSRHRRRTHPRNTRTRPGVGISIATQRHILDRSQQTTRQTDVDAIDDVLTITTRQIKRKRTRRTRLTINRPRRNRRSKRQRRRTPTTLTIPTHLIARTGCRVRRTRNIHTVRACTTTRPRRKHTRRPRRTTRDRIDQRRTRPSIEYQLHMLDRCLWVVLKPCRQPTRHPISGYHTRKLEVDAQLAGIDLNQQTVLTVAIAGGVKIARVGLDDVHAAADRFGADDLIGHWITLSQQRRGRNYRTNLRSIRTTRRIGRLVMNLITRTLISTSIKPVRRRRRDRYPRPATSPSHP